MNAESRSRLLAAAVPSWDPRAQGLEQLRLSSGGFSFLLVVRQLVKAGNKTTHLAELEQIPTDV